MNPFLSKVPGINCSLLPGSSQSDKPIVNFILQTNQDFEYLEKYGSAFLWYVKNKYDGFNTILTSLVPRQREYVIKIDRDKAASLGVLVQDIADTISYLVKGEKVGWVTRDSKRDEMFIQIPAEKRQSLEDLSGIFVKSRLNSRNSADNQKMVSVSDLITITERLAPTSLYHFNKMLSVISVREKRLIHV
jgi:multidrug efflux pump subunit AcrB